MPYGKGTYGTAVGRPKKKAAMPKKKVVKRKAPKKRKQMKNVGIQVRRTNGKKKTRQGQSKNTKFGNKLSPKYYKKRSRGQG